jgi:hypothetical protein
MIGKDPESGTPDVRPNKEPYTMANLAKVMQRMSYNTPVKGIAGLVLETGVGGLASYGIGRVYGQYGGKDGKWYARKAAHLAGGIGKIGAAVVAGMSGGHSTYLGGVLNAVGQSGVDAIFLEKGLRHGRDKAGKKSALLPKGMALPSGAEDMTSIGALGAAPAGRGMSWAQVQEIAEGH